MRRKIIKLSTSTHVISLPVKWLRKNKLAKGDEVDLREKENSLTISSSRLDKGREIILDVAGLGRQMSWRYLDASYEAGYDSIILKRKNQDYLSKAGKHFPGMMIIDERKDTVHLKDIAKETKDIDKILNRIFNMVIALIEDAMIMLAEKDKIGLSRIKKRDTSINSYISYFKRQVTKFHNSDVNITTYIKLIEMLSDKICGYVLQRPKRKELENLVEICRMLQRLHFKFTRESLLEFNRKRKKLGVSDISELLFDIEETQILLKIKKLAE